MEVALGSVVLVTMIGGLFDLGRGLYFDSALHNAAREGARNGIWYVSGTASNPYLDDTDIKAAVDQILQQNGLPASVLQNPGTTCPAPSDSNSKHNPPYPGSAYPAATNTPWLYICYNNAAGTDITTPPTDNSHKLQDLNVILVMRYGLLTNALAFLPSGVLMAANVHMSVQG